MILLAFWPGDVADVCYPGLAVHARACVPGLLYDDRGFPAIVHGEDGVVMGTVLTIDPAMRDDALASLDAHHQVGTSPHRRTIAMATGRDGMPVPVHAWNWTGTDDLPQIIPGDWAGRSMHA